MSERSLSTSDLRSLYGFMVATRGLEERLERLLKRGEVKGSVYRSLGQEATPVGSAFALEEGDWLSPSFRDLGALLVRGLGARAVLLQHMGKGTSSSRGRDDTNHLTIPSLGLLGPISVLGTQLCVLNGVALAFRARKESHVCMTYQGEGATRTGASHEGFAFAAAQVLPIVVVLEHNRWSFSTRSARQAAVESWTDIAKAYGIPAIGVDGNDVLAVYDAALEGVTRARSGGGPTLIVAETYRMLGHAQHDAHRYVPESELERWRARDPVRQFEDYLCEHGFETRDSLAGVRAGVDQTLDAAVDEALSAPMPRPSDARSGVYGTSEPDGTPWTRRSPVGYTDFAPASGVASGVEAGD